MVNPFDDDYVDDAHMSRNIIDNSVPDLTNQDQSTQER